MTLVSSKGFTTPTERLQRKAVLWTKWKGMPRQFRRAAWAEELTREELVLLVEAINEDELERARA